MLSLFQRITFPKTLKKFTLVFGSNFIWCQYYSCQENLPHLEISFAFGACCYYIRGKTANTVQQKLGAIQAFWYSKGFRGESLLKHTKYKLFIRSLLQLQGSPTSDTRQPCTAKGLVATLPD